MLRPKKKISRREIKQDALVTTYANLVSYYEKNRRFIGMVVTGVVVVVIAALIYLKNRTENNEYAMTQLGEVSQLFDGGQYQAAIDGVPEKNIPGLRSIVEKYGNSRGGDLARFLLASALYETGKYDEALGQFKSFSPPDELLASSRHAGIAQCYEAMKEYGEAAGYYEKAVGDSPKEVGAAENLMNAARDYGLAGEKAKALELYRRLKKEYPTSLSARDVDRFIAALSV